MATWSDGSHLPRSRIVNTSGCTATKPREAAGQAQRKEVERPVAKVFIASSVEGRPYAESLSMILKREGAEPLLWWSPKCFPAGATLIESLFALLDRADGALIVATPDDRTVRRGRLQFSPTSNVTLEYGLFSGRLGARQVALVRVGKATLPSDLGGVLHINLPLLEPDEDEASWQLDAASRVVQWLRDLEAASSNGARVARLLDRLAPHASAETRAKLKTEVLCRQVNASMYPRQPRQILEQVLARYEKDLDESQAVGFHMKTLVSTYLNLADVIPDSEDERLISGHLASFVAELIDRRAIEPSLVAISKGGSTRVVRTAAVSLPLPKVLVNPDGPSPDQSIDGFFEPGDRAVMLHDVALSGHHLVQCIATLRTRGILVNDLIVLARHGADSLALTSLMSLNQVNLHCATSYQVDETGGEPASHITAGHQSDTCLLCGVTAESNDVPFRAFFKREELPSEFLLETANLVAVADVAPLSRGHVLMLPKQHVLSMSQMNSTVLTEAEGMRSLIFQTLEKRIGGPIIAFEHGLCDRKKHSNCGIEHAHLHILPCREAVAERFHHDFKCLKEWPVNSYTEISRQDEEEYLTLLDRSGTWHYAKSRFPTSQYFRRAISSLVGNEFWNWHDQVLLQDNERQLAYIRELHTIFTR